MPTPKSSLSGDYGVGRIGRTQVHSISGATTLNYERYVRCQCLTEFVLESPPTRDEFHHVRVCVPRSLLERMRLDRIHPYPVAVESDRDASIYWFSLDEANGQTSIRIEAIPKSSGLVSETLMMGNSDPIHFIQHVYP